MTTKRITHRAFFCLLVLALMTVQPALLSAAPGQTISEDQLSDLHAALVLKIAMFVDWPEDGPELNNGKISLGIAGDDAVFHAFEKLANKKIKGQGLELVHFQETEQLRSIRIMFLAKDDFIEVKPWPGVLTISDSPDFNARGGMIKLSIENGRPRFSINLEAAEAVGIGFSSKLLKVATIYEGEIQ